MKNIRKNICTLIVLMIVLLTICLPSYASSLEVNKEKLEKAFTELFTEPLEDGWTATSEAKLKGITDNEIELEVDGKAIKMNYEIKEDKVIFNKTVNITEGMDYETYEEETGDLSIPLMGYMAVSKIAGIDFEKILNYTLLSMLESAFGSIDFDSSTTDGGYIIVEDGVTIEDPGNTKVIKKSEFGKYAVEYAKYEYKDNIVYNDSKTLKTYSLEFKTDSTEKQCTVECIVTVNLDGNFDKINEMNFESNDNTVKHNYKETEWAEPTCKQDGFKTYECVDCKITYTEKLPALGHDYVERITVEPTCSVEGSRTYACSRCYDSYKVATPTTEHHYVERMRTERECEKDGIIGYICSDCGAVYTKVISRAKGHNYEAVTKAATCTTAGVRIYTCTGCEDSYTETISSAKGHDYTETISGSYKIYKCSGCGDSYTDKISNVDSDEVDEPQVSDNVLDFNMIYILIAGGLLALIVVVTIVIIVIKNHE